MLYAIWARVASTTAIIILMAVPSAGQAHPRKKHRKIILTPMEQIAKIHHWNHIQVADEWLVLKHESGSTPGHVNLTAENGDCWGSGQLQGPSGPATYASYGGNYYTVLGQLEADANYVKERYANDPIQAWQHELETNWY
jgi:hypothetical protein